MKKWKKFEESAHAIVKDFNPDSNVYHGVYIRGKLSKGRRQVDIQVVDPSSYDFISFECKDYKHPVDVPVIEAYGLKLVDIGAKKGAIVSNSGYTQSSINMAESLGIDLLNLVDTGDDDIRTKLFATVLLVVTRIDWMQIKLSGESSVGMTINDDPQEIYFTDSEGRNSISAYEIIARLWNDEDGPLGRNPGVYEYIPNNQNQNLLDLNQRVVPINGVSFVYKVAKKYYAGELPIQEAKGLFDFSRRSFQTRRILTEPLVFLEFEKDEREITKEQAESLQFTLETHVRSELNTES